MIELNSFPSPDAALAKPKSMEPIPYSPASSNGKDPADIFGSKNCARPMQKS